MLCVSVRQWGVLMNIGGAMTTDSIPKESRRRLWRSRWAAIGAAIAVTFGGGGLFVANAASSVPSSVVTIDPVRILDTRDPVNVGLPGPFVSAVSQKLQVSGPVPTTTGTQTPVPSGATGVLLNVTVVSPSADGFLSVRPGDATGAPTTSSLNFKAGDIVPNSVQVGLPTVGANAGQIDITYDAFGQAGPTTDVLIDVVGYMGATGPSGYSAWDVIPSGVTVTGEILWDSHGTTNSIVVSDGVAINLPGIAPVALTDETVNFASGAGDNDATCTGTPTNPTAPAGKVCIYLDSSAGIDVASLEGYEGNVLPARAFTIYWTPDGTDLDEFVSASWAYTAP
jgi:hypothetical protein